MTIAIYAASVALGLVAIALLVLAARRPLTRQTELVTTMLRRYDDRLAEFAQTLNDALAPLREGQFLPAGAHGGVGPDDHSVVVRTLEIARERTDSHAAIALVTGATRTPTFATVGLSQEEASHLSRMGLPDYRGARAIEVSFNGEAAAPPGSEPIRAGLAVSLLESPQPPSMLAVLTRAEGRRFSESDVQALSELVVGARPALERSLGLAGHDPVPDVDPLTRLYDRQSFYELLDRELARARGSGRPLALLVADVDRLTTLNAQIGHLAADGLLAEVAERLRHAIAYNQYACRVAGGRFAVLLPGEKARDGEALFERLRDALAKRPLGAAQAISLSGGVAELLAGDDIGALLGRADAALGMAKSSGRGSVVSAVQ
jgi:diguanylate cyclase (GGDEF)-like protein